MKEKQALSTLTLAVMGLTGQGPMSGYDLRKVFSTTPMGHFSSSPGAIYPALKRLEKDGLVAARGKEALRGKVVYGLTGKGKRALKGHLSQTVTREDVIWRLDELILRFAFMGQVLGADKTIQFLEQFAREVERYVEHLKLYLDEVFDGIPINARLAMEHGIANYGMNAKWARGAIVELKARGS